MGRVSIMKLNTSEWQYFNIKKLFDVDAGKYHYSDEYVDGNTPYCSATNQYNGISQFINLPPDFNGNKIITGKVGCNAFYQPEPFCATSDCNVLSPKFKMTENIGLFLVTVINKNENFRWNYGRQCRVGNTKKIRIQLPVQDGVYDKDHKYSDEGYVPDWKFMESFIDSLKPKKISF